MLPGHQISESISQGSIAKVFYRRPNQGYIFYSCYFHALEPNKLVFFSHLEAQYFTIRIIYFVQEYTVYY